VVFEVLFVYVGCYVFVVGGEFVFGDFEVVGVVVGDIIIDFGVLVVVGFWDDVFLIGVDVVC